MKTHDVVIVGAGPYGLSVASHLKGSGIEPYVLGQPMAFWKDSMPGGMLLRSAVEASNINSPGRLAIFEYEKEIGRKLPNPLPIEDFIAFGEWFQKKRVPTVDTRFATKIARNGIGFNITLDDGEKMVGKSVVLALGIGYFVYRPAEFAGVPRELAPHSSDFRDLAEYKGLRVGVIGKGQSALEYAALLHENGADVEIITRAPGLAYRPFAWRKNLFRKMTDLGPCRWLSYKILPPTDLGDIKTARKMANPDSFRRQPPEVQEKLLKDCARPVGAYWLPERLASVKVRTNTTVKGAEVAGKGVKLTFTDNSSATYDRVMVATGYRIDVSKWQMLDEGLRNQIKKNADGYPAMSTGLETSVDNLYMTGVIGEKTLGPTQRFVTGTMNAGPRLAAAVVAKRGR